jgi:chemotaxis protein methyltransferase CheR
MCAEHLATIARTENRVANLWCAGSATGEEPYTLAILVDRIAGNNLPDRLDVTASDINPEAVGKAREATSTSWSFRGAPGWCFAYFEPSAPGRVTLRSSPIREVVKFTVESCQEGARNRPSGTLDVISFRNVAIYLEEAATRALHNEFARLLKPGGLLAIGPSDPRPVLREFEFVDYFDDAALYRRVIPQAPSSEPYGPSPSWHSGVTPRPLPRSKSSPKKVIAREPRGPEQAIRVVEALAQDAPEDSIALRILGQMHLSQGEAAKATEVLRRGVFLAAEDVLTRYFYALALCEAGDLQQALRQLRNVLGALEQRPSGESLSDQSTKANELLTAARFLESQWT